MDKEITQPNLDLYSTRIAIQIEANNYSLAKETLREYGEHYSAYALAQAEQPR